MREEVMVLPPSAERGPAGFCLTQTELNKWNICPGDGIRAERCSGISKHLRYEGGIDATEFVSAAGVQADISRGDEPCADVPSERDKRGKTHRKGMGKEVIRNVAFLAVYQPQRELSQGTAPLQWGSRKKSRCGRGPKHPPKPPRLCNVADETNPVQLFNATTDFSVATCSSAATSSKLNNCVADKRDHPCSLLAVAAEHAEEECKRKKPGTSGSDSREGQMEVSVQRTSPHTSQQTHQLQCLPHQSMTSSSLEKKSSPPDRHAAALTDEMESGPARKAVGWPKVVIPLSRKEKAEDFSMFKGCKLPLRPKRRPRVVEKALLYCTPGNWLSDVSPSRYNVKEKKRLKRRPSGLKAMESIETDWD